MIFSCQVCGRDLDESLMSPDYLDVCNDCASAYHGQGNEPYIIAGSPSTKEITVVEDSDYLEICEKNDLNPWERQIGESDGAWMLWNAYTSQYPMAKPSLRKAAETVGLKYSTACSYSAKWKYSVRLQHYKVFCDEELRNNRAQKMRDLNEKNYSLADKLHAKLASAVEMVSPEQLAADPRQLVAVAKLATELEEKVILDEKRTEIAEYSPANTGGQKQEKQAAKTSDMENILSILGKAGVLGQIGIETTKTETTRVIAKVDEGDEY